MIACLDIPALPLQLVWRQTPAWRALPVVVVEEERPQGVVLWACERARAHGILPGQRYAHALGLCPSVRARVVAAETITAALDELRRALHRFSPEVEPAQDAPGTFWLDGDGLARLFVSTEAWATQLADAVGALGYLAALVVGRSRFSTFAIARASVLPQGIVTTRAIRIFDDEERERAVARRVPLARLELPPALRDALARLGVTTLGDMVRLPAGGILERFGRDAHRLYQLAAAERWDPVQAAPPPVVPDARMQLDDEEADATRLLFALKPPLERLLAQLAEQRHALVALHLELALKHGVGRIEPRRESITPAAPTLDARLLLRLIHLRLEGLPLSAPVNAARLWADSIAATREQLALFAQKPRRDLRAAEEALAALRAELGDDAVVRPVLREGHLPEASYGWERVQRMQVASPRPSPIIHLVRRIQQRPQLLPADQGRFRDDGWLICGPLHGAVTTLVGPHVVSGGWWASEVRRAYHFAETARGDCLWVYYDEKRRRWFLHGDVE